MVKNLTAGSFAKPTFYNHDKKAILNCVIEKLNPFQNKSQIIYRYILQILTHSLFE